MTLRADDGGAADGVVGRPVLDDHAVVVGQGVRAGRVGADVVPLDDVAGRPRVGDIDAVLAVARDDVAGAERAADGVVAGAGEDGHAAGPVAQGRRAAGGDADVVALDHVAGGPAVDDVDAIPVLPEMTSRAEAVGAADRVVGRAVLDDARRRSWAGRACRSSRCR